MRSVVVIARDADRAAFIEWLQSSGVVFSPVKGLQRHFMVDAESLTHAAIETISDASQAAVPESQAITIDDTFTDGSWALARIVRRAAPWNVDHIKTPFSTYYRAVRDGAGVDIYIVDSGVRTTHDEFGGRLTAVSAPHGSDVEGHGNGVSSMAGGETTGPARGALLWLCQWYGASGGGTVSDIVSALGEVLTHYDSRAGTGRPAVANCSFSTSDASVGAAVADLINEGIVVVSSAGNTGEDLAVASSIYPQSTADVVCVGAIGPADIPAFFARSDGSTSATNYGTRVDVLAPGQYVRAAAASADDAYQRWAASSSGASAMVAGVVACMLQGKSRLTTRAQVQAVRAKLLANATTGRFRAQSQFEIGTLPDRILYLDPDIESETIDGVT